MTIPNVTIGQLRILSAVADRGRFTAAARTLGMTQSGVSQAILTLEHALGACLFSRQRDRVVPTDIGVQVLADAREALRAVERMRQRCASVAGLRSGTLRVASIPSVVAALLPNHLREFRTRFPGIQIVLLEGTDREVCDWVSGGAADVGLTAEGRPGLNADVIGQDELRVVVARRNRLASRGVIQACDLADEPFVMSAGGCEPAVRSIFEDAECSPRIAFTVRDMTALLSMVREGLGTTIVPELALPKDMTGLRCLRLRPARPRAILAVTDNGRQLIPAAQAFRALLMRRAALTDKPGKKYRLAD